MVTRNLPQFCLISCFQLELNVSPVISNLFSSLLDDVASNSLCDKENKLHSECTSANTSKILNLNDIVLGENIDKELSTKEDTQKKVDVIWSQIYNIEKTPALKLSWKQTSLNRKIFELLKVDPENVSELELDLP